MTWFTIWKAVRSHRAARSDIEGGTAEFSGGARTLDPAALNSTLDRDQYLESIAPRAFCEPGEGARDPARWAVLGNDLLASPEREEFGETAGLSIS